VPAAAVIPAPIAYIKVVAVKKLVVGFLPISTGPPLWCVSGLIEASFWKTLLHFTVWYRVQNIYFEEIRVFQAGSRLEYISME
jgi:hypothetical protein